jgi:hypothetical protein
MPTDVDRLSILANTASYLADQTHSLADHAEAAKAHYAAYKAAVSNKKEDRPSLGESHLQRAAKHDRIATDPDSCDQKQVLAQVARRRAEHAPSTANFQAAAKSARAAADSWRAENPEAKTSWEADNWDRQAAQWDEQAAFLEKKGDADAEAADKLEKKLGTAAADGASASKAVPPPPPAKKMNVESFATSSSRAR